MFFTVNISPYAQCFFVAIFRLAVLSKFPVTQDAITVYYLGMFSLTAILFTSGQCFFVAFFRLAELCKFPIITTQLVDNWLLPKDGLHCESLFL